MMNDRFAAQLRQHLLDTANERPADGQLATIVADVAATPQRRPLIARLPWLQGRIGQLPAGVRLALVALALVLAAIAGALLAGGGGSRPSTPFEGRWTAIDIPDGSTLNLRVGAGSTPDLRFEDQFATGDACIADQSKVFIADGVGHITDNRLVASYPNGGGCGSLLVGTAGEYVYDGRTDTLRDQDGVVWTRSIRGGEAPVPTTPPTERPTPSPTLLPETAGPVACLDLSEGGTYTAPTDTLSLTASVPGTPLIPWQGSVPFFSLWAACEQVAPIAMFALDDAAGDLYETSCMPNSGSFATFAKAVARLDTPAGPDISPRVNLTIDGHRAARYDITNLTSCPDGFGLWHGTALGAGETGSVYVIEVDGGLVSIELNRDGSQTPAELAEAYGIVASLRFAR